MRAASCRAGLAALVLLAAGAAALPYDQSDQSVLAAGEPLQAASLLPPNPHPALEAIRSCPPLTKRAEAPTSVHDLRPDEVKVVMAIGDSLSAGFGIYGGSLLKFPKSVTEYRGLSWTMGGEPNALTMPNLLGSFSKELVGASRGEHPIEVCFAFLCPPFQHRPEIDNLNAAQSGAMFRNLKSELSWLIGQIESRPDINMNSDWKVLTIFIGGNDICRACTPLFGPGSTAEKFEEAMREVLVMIREQIPRVYVNLVPIFRITGAYELAKDKEGCKLIRPVTSIFCPCPWVPIAGESNRKAMDKLGEDYNRILLKLAKEMHDPKNQLFGIGYQDSIARTPLEELDPNFISEFDCFHPKLGAHEILSIALWNDMISPPGRKPAVRVNGTYAPLCPTDASRLYTGVPTVSELRWT